MLKEPIEVVYNALEEPIGHPRDIATNIKHNGSVNFNEETAIPRTASTSGKNQTSAMLVDQVAGEAVPAVRAFEEVSQKSDCQNGHSGGAKNGAAAAAPAGDVLMDMHGNGLRMRGGAANLMAVPSNGNNNGMPSMYMPIKALNTFSRDWKI